MNEFYSKNWSQMNKFSVYSRPHYDILIDKDYLYLIKIPNYNHGLWTFLLFGLAMSVVGDTADTKEREEYRSSWINSEGNIVSNNFEKDIFLKIPLIELPNVLVYKKNGVMSAGFILNYAGEKMILGNSKIEYKRLMTHLEERDIKIITKGILN